MLLRCTVKAWKTYSQDSVTSVVRVPRTISDLMLTVDRDGDYKNTKLSFRAICLIRA